MSKRWPWLWLWRLATATLVVAALSACQPRDVDAGDARDRLEQQRTSTIEQMRAVVSGLRQTLGGSSVTITGSYRICGETPTGDAERLTYQASARVTPSGTPDPTEIGNLLATAERVFAEAGLGDAQDGTVPRGRTHSATGDGITITATEREGAPWLILGSSGECLEPDTSAVDDLFGQESDEITVD